MPPTNLLLLFFLITFFGCRPVTCARLHGISGNGDFIKSTCTKTLYYDLCLSSLQSDPRSRTADLKGLAKVALAISINNGTNIISHVNSLKSQKNTTTAPFVSSCLDDCINEYNEAIGNLQDATEALENKSYDTVDSLITAAMTDSDTCEDGFNDETGSKSPLTKENELFSMLCSNALAISNLLV